MEVLRTNPDNIKVVNRTRQFFEGIEELGQSMKEHGQIHPIRVTSDLVLIAGERRLRAAKHAGIEIEYIVKDNCSEIELKELELRENLDRKDMTWVERDKGLAELDALKKKQHGAAEAGRANKGWGLGDTANLTGETKSTVHDAVKMAKALEVFPELASCTSHNEAKKKLNKIVEKLAIAELASRSKEQASGISLLADEHFIVGDAFVGLQSLPAESVDFVNCDTPYGIDLTEQKKIQSGVRTDEDYKEWSRDDYVKNISLVAAQCFRVLKQNTWMVFWYGQEWYFQVRSVLEDAGFKVDKIPACWYGGAGAAQTMAPEVNLARCYEQFFICRKGDPILVKRGRPNVFAYDKVPAQKKIHPTEKPIELMLEIYSVFTLPGAKCLIPFIGSGNDLRAGYMYGNHCFGFDLNQDVKNNFLLRVADDERAGLYSSTNIPE